MDFDSTSRDTIESSLQGGEQDFLVSDSELRNLRGGSFRRENERPTPINLSKSLISQQIGYSVECTRKSNFRKAQIDFLPSPPGEGKMKAAFTLAEVLITLGIIGVVAALTLPTLISNYQKRVYVTQLKKSVSVLSNGFKLMMGHEGATLLSETEAFSGISGINNVNGGAPACQSDNILRDECRSIREGLQNVFSGVQFAPCGAEQVKFLNGTIASSLGTAKSSNETCIKFPDGSESFFYRFYVPSGNSLGNTGYNYIMLDINGPKNPNTWGRDIFYLYLYNSGIIVPNGTQQTSHYWRTETSSSYKCDTSSKGMACAGRVLEEDAMNY